MKALLRISLISLTLFGAYAGISATFGSTASAIPMPIPTSCPPSTNCLAK